jgi:undecaprenyl-diphosphatase
MPSTFRHRFEHLSLRRFDNLRSLLKPLAAGFVVMLLLLGFALLASEVLEGQTHGIDTRLLREAQQIREAHPWFTQVMRDLSGLGSTVVLTLFTVATAGYLLLVSARITAVLVVASTVSCAVLINLLKVAFSRMRPDVAFADHVAWGMSFPSGHASMSAAVFLTLGVLTATTRSRLSERLYILAVAAATALLIGASRVALGVHWATDVLAGWAIGAAWAMAWLLIAYRLVHSEISGSATFEGDA